MALYDYRYKKLPDAGAMQYAFYPVFENPVYTLPGRGTPYSFQWKATQPEQLYYNQAQRMDGLAGVVAGQMALQSLVDTRGVAGAEG